MAEFRVRGGSLWRLSSIVRNGGYGRGVLTGFRVRDRYCFNTLLVFKEIVRNGGYGAVENDCSCLCGWLR